MVKAKKTNKGIVTNADIENGQMENTERSYFMLGMELSARALMELSARVWMCCLRLVSPQF